MKAKLTLTLLIAAALCSGCEILGPILVAEASGSGDPATPTSAALSVEIESASGTVAGRSLAPEMFVPSGMRIGDELNFHLAIPGEELELFVVMSQTESSSTNPYTGEGMVPGGEPIGRPLPEDPAALGGSVGARSFSDVMLCDRGSCASAEDFGVEVVQTADGRQALVDGAWGATGSALVTFRYAESD